MTWSFVIYKFPSTSTKYCDEEDPYQFLVVKASPGYTAKDELLDFFARERDEEKPIVVMEGELP